MRSPPSQRRLFCLQPSAKDWENSLINISAFCFGIVRDRSIASGDAAWAARSDRFAARIFCAYALGDVVGSVWICSTIVSVETA